MHPTPNAFISHPSTRAWPGLALPLAAAPLNRVGKHVGDASHALRGAEKAPAGAARCLQSNAHCVAHLKPMTRTQTCEI